MWYFNKKNFNGKYKFLIFLSKNKKNVPQVKKDAIGRRLIKFSLLIYEVHCRATITLMEKNPQNKLNYI